MDKQQKLTFNEKNITGFRVSHGQIASFGDAPLLLLTTTGARSGQRRTSPMMFLADEHDPDRVYVFASYAGADQNPAWFHNIVAHPDDIEVELGDERYAAAAEVLAEPGAPRCMPPRPAVIPASLATKGRRHGRSRSSR